MQLYSLFPSSIILSLILSYNLQASLINFLFIPFICSLECLLVFEPLMPQETALAPYFIIEI